VGARWAGLLGQGAACAGKKKKARPLGLSAGEMGLTGVLFFFYFKTLSKQFKICLKYF